jgi:hypothetical protein
MAGLRLAGAIFHGEGHLWVSIQGFSICRLQFHGTSRGYLSVSDIRPQVCAEARSWIRETPYPSPVCRESLLGGLNVRRGPAAR